MKKEYIFMIIFITSLSLGIIGLSYSWFSTKIMGNESAKDIIVDADQIKLIYTDTTPLLLSDAMPGDTITKTFTVQNTGSSAAEYQIKWKDLINGFKAGELKISLTCISKDENDNVSGTCESIEDKMIPYTETQNDYKIKDNIEIDANITHEYTLTLEFVEKNKEQDYNQGVHFEGKINITKANQKPVNNCTFDGSLTQGAEYTNGQYTYRYKQQGSLSSWYDIYADGWGVKLTNKTSTDSVTTPLCTSINGKPIVSMSYMFYGSQATTLDLSSFDTSKVTDMTAMFWNSQATTLDLSSFDTSNVTSMIQIFFNSKATTLDLSSFDTSKVTNMSNMFADSQATTLDLSGFDTSNVTTMSGMFGGSQATSLDLSGFDTSKVTDMQSMFRESKATTLDLSSFDTSNVTSMLQMFYYSEATQIIGLDKFNTSKVTNMQSMFWNSKATELDLSSFDTSNVTSMTQMFYESKATQIIGLDKFNTSKVTNMKNMFHGSQATTLNLSSFDTSNVTDMGWMFSRSQATTLDLSSFDTSKVTNMYDMFWGSQATTIYVSDKWNTSLVTNSSDMFYGVTNLVGGEGTTHSYSNPTDKTYAHVDGGTSNPGYFTYKAN